MKYSTLDYTRFILYLMKCIIKYVQRIWNAGTLSSKITLVAFMFLLTVY